MKKASEYQKAYRLKYPIRYHWNRLRWRTKQRNQRRAIPLTCGISFEDFHQWCMETNYHELTGPNGHHATIDRIIDEIGYEKGNLQMLSRVDNTVKENDRRVGKSTNMEWKPASEYGEENPF